MVKGGHLPGSPTDYLFDGALHKFQSERLNSHNTHGTGCVLSSAIASYKAQGLELKEAIAQAKQFLFNAIKKELAINTEMVVAHSISFLE